MDEEEDGLMSHSSDGKCPDIYDCRLGVNKILRDNLKLRERNRRLLRIATAARKVVRRSNKIENYDAAKVDDAIRDLERELKN
jgi:hypothetical protein